MKVYFYDEETREFKNEADASLDPLESKLQGKDIYLLPMNATFEKPDLQEGFASVFNGSQWENVEDNRGKEYWFANDEYGTPARTMKELGTFPANAVFTAPVKTLDELKADKINEFKSIRDTKEVKPIAYNGNLFDYDDKARDRINAAIIALDTQGEGASISWTTAANQETIVNAADLRGVVAAVAARSNTLHVKYRELKVQCEAAQSEEELDAIVWEAR